MSAINTLGPSRINAIASAQPRLFDQFLTAQIAEIVERDLIASKEGILPHEIVQNVLPLATTAADVKVGFNVDAFEREVNFGNRAYDCDRFAERRGYSQHLANDRLYNAVKNTLVPSIRRDVTYAVDSLLMTILSGAGTALTSRDITSVAVGTAWKTGATYTGAPMADMMDAVNKTSGDLVYLSDAAYQLLAQHPQINDANTGSNGGTAWMSRGDLADKLKSVLGVNEVWIGNRLYHNGIESAAYNPALTPSGLVAYVGRKANIQFIPFSGEDLMLKEYVDEPKSKAYVQGEMVADVITVSPALSRTLTGLTA